MVQWFSHIVGPHTWCLPFQQLLVTATWRVMFTGFIGIIRHHTRHSQPQGSPLFQHFLNKCLDNKWPKGDGWCKNIIGHHQTLWWKKWTCCLSGPTLSILHKMDMTNYLNFSWMALRRLTCVWLSLSRFVKQQFLCPRCSYFFKTAYILTVEHLTVSCKFNAANIWHYSKKVQQVV